VAVRFPSLVGPVYLSVANAQLFSCESNSTLASREARAFDLDGKQAFTFADRGYLRDCGIRSDERVYWLIYNAAIGGIPTKRSVVLNSLGEVVARAEFPESRSLRFSVAGKTYTLSVPRAEMPG